MKFETVQNEKTDIPVAFIDTQGNLWFRSKDAIDMMDNEVYVLTPGAATSVDYYDMNVFVAALNKLEQKTDENYTVKKFYEGDTLTITF